MELTGSVLDPGSNSSNAPWGDISELLNRSFDAACCSWSCVDIQWVDHMEGCWPIDYLPSEPPGERPPDGSWQPLLRWYALTGETGPQSIERIPRKIVDGMTAARWKEFADPMGIRSQISIPLTEYGPGHHAFVMSRPDRDYGDDNIEFARLLQPLLTGLFRHYRSFSHLGALSHETSSLDLTAREMTVLGLLAKGMTSSSIGRYLSISPRTAQKHLEHIYRKLDVNDRLLAVQRAFDVLPPQCGCGELHGGCCFRGRV